MNTIQEALAEMNRVMNDKDVTPAPVQDWLRDLILKIHAFESSLSPSAVGDPTFEKGQPIPPSIGAQADLYATVRAKRLEMEKAAKAVHDRETEIYNVILAALSESPDSGASGKTYRVQLVMKDRMNVEDWPVLWSHIRQTGEFDLLQKRLSDTAAKEWVETYGRPLPGTKTVEVPTLSFNKV